MSGRGSLLSTSLEAEFIAKNVALYDADEITSGLFMMEGTDGLPLLKISLEIFQNIFVFNLYRLDTFRQVLTLTGEKHG